MSERLHFEFEKEPHKQEQHETVAKSSEKSQVEKSPDAKNKELEAIRLEALEHAKATEDLIKKQERESNTNGVGQAYVDRELKNMAYHRLLKRAQRQLPGYQRAVSKIMHQPAIDAASEATARTVGRPSGILGGGMLAFAGSLVYYFLTRHYGYDYNFFVFTALVIGGFLIGWTLELLWRMLTASKRS